MKRRHQKDCNLKIPESQRNSFLDSSNCCPTDIQEADKHILTTLIGDNNNPPLTLTTLQIEERLVRKQNPLARTKLKFDIEDNTYAEHFVVQKKLRGPIPGLHFMIHNSVSIDTTHGLINFPRLTMQVKSAASEISAKT